MQSAKDLAGFDTLPNDVELVQILSLGKQIGEDLDAVLSAINAANEAG